MLIFSGALFRKVFISSSACNLKHGASQTDMKDLTGHATRVFSEMDNGAPSAAYQIEPLTGSNVADRYLFQIHSNASAWTNFVGNIVGSPEGQMLLRHRNKVLNCNQSLWNGLMVIGSMNQE